MDDPRITPIGQACAADLEAYRAALDELVDVQARIDRLHAERARALVAVEEAGLRVHLRAVVGEAPDASHRLDDTLGDALDAPPSAKRLEFARRSMRLEAAMSLSVSERSVDRLLDEAGVLVRDLPETLAALEAGRINWRCAGCIAGEALAVEPGLREAFDAQAVRIAVAIAPSRLRTRLIALRDRIAPIPATERHAIVREDRRVVLEDVGDGMSWLHAYLPAAEAHAVHHRLTAVARAAAEFDAEDGIGDARTLGQRRADLLVDFLAADYVSADELETSAAARERRFARGVDLGRFAGIRPTVVVTVPVMTLAGRERPGDDPPMLDGVVPIDPATARALAANAPALHRLLVDPHTGVRLDLGRERYQVSTELRLWLRLRDGTCRAPGCGRLATGCDVDHTLDWQYGGATRADNFAHLCRGHHTLKHQTRWAMRQQADGTISWRSPAGFEYETRPAGAFAVAA